MDHDRQAAFEAAVDDNIAKHGVHLTGVFPTATDPGPPFCYTAGMAEKGLPELIIFGLSHHGMGGILNELAERMIAKEHFARHEPLDGILSGGYKVMLIEFPVEQWRDHVGVAMGRVLRTGSEGMMVLQVVWPDTEHRWPWEEGYDIDPERQPVFGDHP